MAMGISKAQYLRYPSALAVVCVISHPGLAVSFVLGPEVSEAWARDDDENTTNTTAEDGPMEDAKHENIGDESATSKASSSQELELLHRTVLKGVLSAPDTTFNGQLQGQLPHVLQINGSC